MLPEYRRDDDQSLRENFIMETPTPTGGVEVTDVDSAAEALIARFETDPQPEVEEVEATEDDGMQGDEDEIAPDETDADESEAETRFESLSELAEAAGMEFEDFMKSIKANVKINGKEGEVSLAELKKGYQLESDYTRKNMEFVEQKRQFDEQQAQAQNRLNTELQRAGIAFKMAQQQLTHDFNAIDWKSLEKDDPQAYLLKRQQFGERQAQLDQGINQALANAQQIQQRQQQQNAQKAQEIEARERELLVAAMPQWKDSKVRESESQAIAEYMTANGFTPEEIGSIRDHRVFVLAHRAMQAQKAATSTDLARKKVVSAPKLVKGNARQSANQSNAKRISTLKAKAKQTGSVDDLAELLIARGN